MGTRLCPRTKGMWNSHGREFDLRTDQFAYQGNIQRMMKSSGIIMKFKVLIGFVGYAGWFWTELLIHQ